MTKVLAQKGQVRVLTFTLTFHNNASTTIKYSFYMLVGKRLFAQTYEVIHFLLVFQGKHTVKESVK